MPELPPVGTRVSLRYRLPVGSVPPLTDVIGHLLAIGPTLSVRTKRGDVVDVAFADVVAIKALAAAPVRTGEIRNIEYAAALAWPGVEQQWLEGWLLRFGRGRTRRANSAVPLDVPTGNDVGALIDWYAARAAAPLVAAPDRLLRIPLGVPTDEWLGLYRRDVPVDVLTAVIDGEVAFATTAGGAVGRAAITTAPDATRWVGLSAVHVGEAARHGPRTVQSAVGVGRRSRCDARLRAGARRQHRGDRAVRVDGLFRSPPLAIRRCS